jgi:hypothetical protein
MAIKKKILLFQLSFLAVAFVVIEITLRVMGYRPGDMKPNWLNFHPVDSLIISDVFYTNSEGLLVANRNHPTHVEFINHDGYRSKEFDQVDTTKKKIMFIGDSFTWGFSAQPIKNNCFADIVGNETDYEIINLGIPAADPPQYAAVAKKFIPRFKPEIVLVVFFMGNDLMTYDRAIAPNKPVQHFTNAGVIYADMDGRHFATAKEAYHYVTAEKYFLFHPTNVFEWIISKSALLSRLYSVRFRYEEKARYEKMVKHTELTKKYLRAIKEVAEENGSAVRFVLIPEVKEADMTVTAYIDKYGDLLRDSTLQNYWWIPPTNAKAYYNDYPDAHLNNKGHRFYGDFLKEQLKRDFKL